MKLIPITQGRSVQVDDSDFQQLSQYKWSLFKVKDLEYAKTKINGNTVMIHRMIMGCSKGDGILIDHRDHNGLNCQRYNIREVTQAQNMYNRRKIKKSRSIYKGLYHENRLNHWVARIKMNGKFIYLGKFSNETDAAIAYNIAAITYYGEFASLNPIQI